MIKLLENQYIDSLSEKYGLDINYLNRLSDNREEYMYISINDDIDGYMICLDDGNYIHIKELIGNNYSFLKHIVFNANKDISIEKEIEGLSEFGFALEGNKYIRKYEQFRPSNIEIFDYFKQEESFKKILLDQIAEPIWKGAKNLYDRVVNKVEDKTLFIMFDKERNHIISFCILCDFDEIESDELKPWIGNLYTFRPYRGNRYSETLIKYALKYAKNEGNKYVYISSDNEGMYQKYGFELIDMMKTIRGNTTQVFRYDLNNIK
jgi:GNAT superfamily N-acetyltransferase